MESLPAFRLLRPGTVAEALEMRGTDPQRRFLAGGTDLLVNMRRGIAAAEALIDLGGIEELRRIEPVDGGLCIGAAVTLAELAADPMLAETCPVVVTAARSVAGPSHRQAATVGGNLCLDTRCIYYNQGQWWRRSNDFCLKDRGDICHVAPTGERCHAAFSGDLAPALLVLGAEAEIAGAAGRRTIALEDLYADDGAAHLRLGAGELLCAVRLPAADGLCADYAKARPRGAVDFPLAGVAVAVERNADILARLRVALTGTNPRPLVIEGTGDLTGGPLDEGTLKRLDKMVQKQIQPMRTTFGASHHRRRLASVLARRLAVRLFAD